MNTFHKQLRELRESMPSHKLEATQLGSVNYITCKPINALVSMTELIQGSLADMSYIPSLDMFISMVKGNNKKLYK